ncbi:MAG: hypothetical protein M2R45_04560 [Verrucomicrobia subdivision 3 bacterium]|nr:hypothetical protein [Limisphaerales bacterium]MCS1416801.1 hypothetical protein [Limisphaerales bacterium]
MVHLTRGTRLLVFSRIPDFATVNAFAQRLRQKMKGPRSLLRFVTDLLSPLDILRKMPQVQHENQAEFYRVPSHGDCWPRRASRKRSSTKSPKNGTVCPLRDGSTLVDISVLTGFIFRSFRMAVVSLSPNLLPILISLNAFSILGMPFSATAAFVSSIALGICVDDMIHLFTKYASTRRCGQKTEAAIAEATENVGAPVIVTTIVFINGFGALRLGQFVPNIMLGIHYDRHRLGHRLTADARSPKSNRSGHRRPRTDAMKKLQHSMPS